MNYGNEIRQHYYLPKTVIISPKRVNRPKSFTEQIKKVSNQKCVLCNSHEQSRYIVESAEGWVIKAVGNPYGSLSEHHAHAYGYQEVIIESSNHVTQFSKLSIGTIKLLLDTYVSRSESLKRKPHIRYVSIFKNNGYQAGASLEHTHSQVYAFPFIPDKVNNEITALHNYKNKHKSCAICDIVLSESKDKVRVVYESDNVIAICPFASEYNYELLIIPKTHTASLTKTTNETRYDIATILKKSIHYLDSVEFAYNYYVNDMHRAGTHFYLRITPRLTTFGGLENATDITVVSVTPERAAAVYREFVRSPFVAPHYATAK